MGDAPNEIAVERMVSTLEPIADADKRRALVIVNPFATTVSDRLRKNIAGRNRGVRNEKELAGYREGKNGAVSSRSNHIDIDERGCGWERRGSRLSGRSRRR